MRVKLSPFVYKVKGRKNYLLFDALKRSIYNIIPEGTIEELEEELIKNDLVIETNGVIPFKFKPFITPYKTSLIIRELQIRITGRCSQQCKSCGNMGECFREELDMPPGTLGKIINQIEHIHVETIVLIGGDPLIRMDLIEVLRKKVKFADLKVYVKDIDLANEKLLHLKNNDITITDTVCKPQQISEDLMEVDVSKFFYNQDFNPCWGNKIAIDLNGDIKPCLWTNIKIGNINEHEIRELIFAGKFDYFWQLTKSKFDVCKDCEYRFSCSDCRVVTNSNVGSLLGKTSYCSYNPETGEWGSE